MIARALGAKPKQVTESQRVLYHAAAVFASNFVDVVFAEGVRQLRRLGWSEKEAVAALLPLLDGAVANIHATGPVGALTGPIRRGDADTVRRHLEALENPELYRMLGSIALEIAKEAGLEPAAAGRIKRALTRDVAATLARPAGCDRGVRRQNPADRQSRPVRAVRSAVKLASVLAEAVLTTNTTPITFRGFVLCPLMLVPS